jgi:hypothetical protein
MGMEVRGRVAIDGSRCVVLEGCSDPLACRLGWIIAADPSLYILLCCVQGGTHGISMSFPNLLISANEASQADRLWSVEREVPARTVAQLLAGLGLNCVAVFNELLAGLWVLPFQPIEGRCRHFARQFQRGCKASVPLAAQRAALGEVRIRCG